MTQSTFTKLFFCLSVLIPFVAYILGLAPGVTLEDSGELITASYLLGVPHPPGYPLFTILGYLFSYLPVGDVAYRYNLFSATLSSLASGVLFLAGRDILFIATQRLSLISNWLSLFAAVLISLAPSYYRQSVITEVYGLTNLVSALLIFLMLRWIVRTNERKFGSAERLAIAFAFAFGLALSSHHILWYFGPIGFALLFVFAAPYRRTLSFWLRSLALFFLGLLPYIYLPIAASRSPELNWGNPVDWPSFYRTITRFQYAKSYQFNPEIMTEQLREQVILLIEQVGVSGLTVGMVGLYFLIFRLPRLGALTGALLIASGPLTALITNFEVPLFHETLYTDVRSLVSVMYLGHYQVWSLCIAVGLIAVIQAVKIGPFHWRAVLVAATAGAYVLFSGVQTVRSESKAQYTFAEDFFFNMEVLADDKPAMILSNWDPFYFPSLYFQRVQGRGTKLIFIDLQLLRAPWYLQDMARRYPEVFDKAQVLMQTYLTQIQLYLDRKSPLTPKMEKAFSALTKELVAKAQVEMPVYLTVARPYNALPVGLLDGYTMQSHAVAAELVKEADFTETISIERFRFRNFNPPHLPNDRLARIFHNYYVDLISLKAWQMKDFSVDKSQITATAEKAKELLGDDHEALKALAAKFKELGIGSL